MILNLLKLLHVSTKSRLENCRTLRRQARGETLKRLDSNVASTKERGYSVSLSYLLFLSLSLVFAPPAVREFTDYFLLPFFFLLFYLFFITRYKVRQWGKRQRAIPGGAGGSPTPRYDSESLDTIL